jgi:hypothetical protein
MLKHAPYGVANIDRRASETVYILTAQDAPRKVGTVTSVGPFDRAAFRGFVADVNGVQHHDSCNRRPGDDGEFVTAMLDAVERYEAWARTHY